MGSERALEKQAQNTQHKIASPHKTIFIDWHNTLSAAGFWHHWSETQPEYMQLIQDNFFGNDIESTEQWMRGGLSAEDAAALLSERTGIPEQTLLEGLRESAETLPLIDDSVLDIISTIRKFGIEVVIATDNMDTFPRWTVPALRLDEHSDDILDSHTLNALKADTNEEKHSTFFHDYLQVKNVRPEDMVLFDDAADFVESFGIHYMPVTEDEPLRSRLETYIRQNELA